MFLAHDIHRMAAQKEPWDEHEFTLFVKNPNLQEASRLAIECLNSRPDLKITSITLDVATIPRHVFPSFLRGTPTLHVIGREGEPNAVYTGQSVLDYLQRVPWRAAPESSFPTHTSLGRMVDGSKELWDDGEDWSKEGGAH